MRVAAAVALAIVLVACSPTVPVSPPASEVGGSIPPTAAPTIPPAPTSELVGWHKVATTDAMGNGPAAVTWFKDRWVAIGADRSGKQWHPLAWWSADGVTWASGSLGKVPAGGVSSALVGLAVQGDTLVAFGWSSSALDLGSTVDLARAGGSPAGDAASGHVVAAVTRGSTGATLAVQCIASLRSANALVMTSTDGATWTTVADCPRSMASRCSASPPCTGRSSRSVARMGRSARLPGRPRTAGSGPGRPRAPRSGTV